MHRGCCHRKKSLSSYRIQHDLMIETQQFNDSRLKLDVSQIVPLIVPQCGVQWNCNRDTVERMFVYRLLTLANVGYRPNITVELHLSVTHSLG